MIFIRDDTPSKEIKSQLPEHIGGIFIEINIRKIKWLLMGGYNPQKDNISNCLGHVSKGLDNYLANYDNILLLGDFNSTMSEKPMKDFCELYDLQNLIKDPTCYKNASNPSSIDVILTNRKNSFQNSMTIDYFIEAVDSQEIETYCPNNNGVPEDISEIIKKYETHSRLLKIKENLKFENKFFF